MISILNLVNSVSSTSFAVEIAHAINEQTTAQVTVGSLMQSKDDDLDPDIQSMNLSTEFFSGQSNFDLRPYKRLDDHIQSNDYDLVHTHRNFSGSVSRMIGRFRGLKIVNTEHNDLRHFSTAQRTANTATFMLPDINIYNSKSTKSSLNPMARRLSQRDEIIYNGVDIARVDTGAEYPLPVDLPDGTLVTNVGVMTKQKNQQAILETAHKVKQDTSLNDVYFVIAGSGPLLDELKVKTTQLQINDIVFFTGYLPEREHIYRLLHESDLFILPSIYEGFCVAAVEAMAAGLPVIASDIDVLHEVIGEPGLFADPDDPTEFADLLTALAEDPERRKRLGTDAKERARSTFPLERTALEYYNIYKQLAESAE
jgi:glycosyltransferase involved in cell wall biosynthesis